MQLTSFPAHLLEECSICFLSFSISSLITFITSTQKEAVDAEASREGMFTACASATTLLDANSRDSTTSSTLDVALG